MGTNYYARINCCEACGRFSEVHVGKQSYGWPFCLSPKEPTWAAWRSFLEHEGALIFDEYGREMPLVEFLQHVEESGRKPLPRTHYSLAFTPDDFEYRDPEGYRFSKREGFS